MKRPSFQFYPADWLRDTSLRMCSLGARGLWIEMMCHMHEGSPYGYLKVNHKVILPDILARFIGATIPETEGWLRELESAGVFSRDDEGAIFSRRMVRDEKHRECRAEGGKKGGNPALKARKVNLKDNLPPNLPGNLYDETKVNQKPTPSSSSSSSSSYSTIPPNPQGGDGGDLISNDRKRAPRRKRASEPTESDPRHSEFIKAYCEAWEAVHGSKYNMQVNAGRDVKALHKFLKDNKEPVEALIRMVRWTWEAMTDHSPWCIKKTGTIHGFCEAHNDIVVFASK